MTRGMLAKVLHNLESNPSQPFARTFSDVAPDAWYSEAVAWAAERGIVSGYGNGLFGPGDNITREQLAVMLWRYAGEPDVVGMTDDEAQRLGDQFVRVNPDAVHWIEEDNPV